MRLFPTLLLLLCLWLSACKKETNSYANLRVTGLGAVAFISGDAISIYGAGFDTIPGNNVVLFNGVAGEVATATANRLQVIVPLLVTSGKLTVQAHGQTAEAPQAFHIANLLQGAYNDNLTLTADKQYLLRGNVVFNGKLIIEPGTVIYGEKLTHGGLTVQNVDFEGTADKPIVFTSDQPAGSRQPGDWVGINTLGNPQGSGSPLGIIEYVRIEFAGYYAPGQRGRALTLVLDPSSIFRYIQTSYSSGDGMVMVTQPGSSSGGYAEHLVAFGCGGDDFKLGANGGLTLQYGLGIKDPYYAEPVQGNGIVDSVQALDVLSNFTMIGYNPAARNISSPAGQPLTRNAGRGVKIGDGSSGNLQFFLYNSVVAGSWAAGASLWCGTQGGQPAQSNWTNYEDSIPADVYANDVALRNNFFTAVPPALPPYQGGMLGRENFIGYDGFEDISGSTQLALFGHYNDTTRRLDLLQGQDELGIRGLTDYKMFHQPSPLPLAGSPLLTGAKFQVNTPADIPLLNKDISYIGAFGTQDWTLHWTNFNPQLTSY